MKRRRNGARRDLVGGLAGLLLLIFLAIMVAAQFGLAHSSWRPRLSLIDALEGERLGGKDLPSEAGLW